MIEVGGPEWQYVRARGRVWEMSGAPIEECGFHIGEFRMESVPEGLARIAAAVFIASNCGVSWGPPVAPAWQDSFREAHWSGYTRRR